MYTHKSFIAHKNPKASLSAKQLAFNNTMILLAAMSFISYWGLFQIINRQAFLALPTTPIRDVSSRVISMVSSAIILFWTSLYLKKHISFSTWNKSLAIGIGYFLFDFCRCFFLDTINFNILLESVIHHILLLIIIINYLYKYPNLVAVGLLSEVTNFFLYPCWFLYKRGDVDTILFKILAILGLICFLISRVYSFTKILHHLHKKKATYFELGCFGTITLMNYYWFIKLLKRFFIS